jgi:pentalenene oxygenase
MRDEIEAMTARWVDGVPIAADRELMQTTLRVVGRTLFSTDLADDVVDEIVSTVPVVLDGVGRRARDPFGVLEKLPTPGNRRFTTSLRRMREVVDRTIARYRADGGDHGDMASMLMLAVDADTGERLTDLQVRDEVVTMLIAGTETTSNTVAWVLHVLGGRPDLRARLYAELDEVLAGRQVSIEDIPRLEFVRRLISESLRLYPQAWMLIRTAMAATRLGDVELPAGTSVLLPLYAIQRDAANFPDPNTFDPDRWAPERASDVVRPAFLPFSAGRHVCVGEAFAWTEAASLLAVIGQRWHLEPVPGRPVRMNSYSTLKPTQLPMIPRRR